VTHARLEATPPRPTAAELKAEYYEIKSRADKNLRDLNSGRESVKELIGSAIHRLFSRPRSR